MAKGTLSAIIIASIAILAAVSLVEGYGGRLGGITEVKDVRKNEEVQKLGRFCVEEYNRSSHGSNGGGEVRFREVVAAQKQLVSGTKYYLKISAIQSGESKMFDSVVVVKPWLRSKLLVRFAPSTDLILNKF